MLEAPTVDCTHSWATSYISESSWQRYQPGTFGIFSRPIFTIEDWGWVVNGAWYAQQAKVKAVLRRQMRHVLFTEVSEARAGEEVTLYYNPRNTPLVGSSCIWLTVSSHRPLAPGQLGSSAALQGADKDNKNLLSIMPLQGSISKDGHDSAPLSTLLLLMAYESNVDAVAAKNEAKG